MERVREAAKLLDLEPYLDRKPRNLSGGQRQRVAMGRAIVRHPQVYLMDEPLSNLDAKLRVQTRTELVELQQRLAVTTVYVTHDQVEAMTMGHRVAVLRDGDPAAVRRTVDALPRAGESLRRGIHRLARDEHAARLGERAAADRRAPTIGIADDLGGERATVGFRPEAVVIGDGPIAGRIRIVEDLGSEVFVHLVIDHEGEERRIVAKVAAPFAGSPGDNVRLGLRGTVHLFDTAEVRRDERHAVTTVLVTGAAGDIGAAIAEVLARRGHRLVLADHPSVAARLDETAELCRRLGAEAEA